MTIYLGLHVVLGIAILAFVVANLLGGIGRITDMRAAIATTLVVYVQSQFLAAWIALGAGPAAVRIPVGAVAANLLFATSFSAWMAETRFPQFSLKTAAVFTLLPLVVVCVGLLPEVFSRRRIRFVERPLRGGAGSRQFSLRTIFIYTLLAGAFVGVCQFFPIRIDTGDEEPWLWSPPLGGGILIENYIALSYSAAVLAIPVATIVAAHVLLLPGRVWWLIPAPALAGLAGGVAASAMEMGGIPVEAALIGVACAGGSVFPIAHFLIVRACGYRMITEEKSPTPDA